MLIHIMPFSRIRTMFSLHNNIALGILLFSILLSSFILTDPFRLLQPNSKINLTAEQIEDLSSAITAECTRVNGQERSDCYKEKMSELAEKTGLLTSEEVLKSLQDKDEYIKTCHLVGHYIGKNSYERAPRDFWKLIELVNTNICASGIMHGIIEGYIGDNPEIELGGEFANLVCSVGTYQYKQNECVHIMGHMILLSTYGDFNEALPLCSTVKKNWLFYCYNGFFMEDHQKLMLSDHGIQPRPEFNEEYIDALEEKCRVYDKDKIIGRACWTEMAEIYIRVYGYSIEKVYQNCQAAKEAEFIRACYLKGVIALSVAPTFSTPDVLATLCKYYAKGTENYAQCTNDLISANLFNSFKSVKKVTAFCAKEEEKYRGRCYQTIADRLKQLVSKESERAIHCRELPEQYQSRCLPQTTATK